ALAIPGAERPTRSGQDYFLDTVPRATGPSLLLVRAFGLSHQALPYSAVLAVYGPDAYPFASSQAGHYLSGHNQGLFVRQGDLLALLQRRQRGRETGVTRSGNHY